jgi:hypothetical protein
MLLKLASVTARVCPVIDSAHDPTNAFTRWDRSVKPLTVPARCERHGNSLIAQVDAPDRRSRGDRAHEAIPSNSAKICCGSVN